MPIRSCLIDFPRRRPRPQTTTMQSCMAGLLVESDLCQSLSCLRPAAPSADDNYAGEMFPLRWVQEVQARSNCTHVWKASYY